MLKLGFFGLIMKLPCIVYKLGQRNTEIGKVHLWGFETKINQNDCSGTVMVGAYI